jgi:hypothetical protein
MGTRLGTVARHLNRARRQGLRETMQRAVRFAHRRLDAGSLDSLLLPGDIAESHRVVARPRPPVVVGRRLRVGWVTTPPAAWSGGHTTMFRMVQGLERAGHECVVLVYDRHGGDLRPQADVVRQSWPWVNATVRSVDAGFADLDACVATGWETAHVLAVRRARVHPFYFVQDFEPFFYPHGSSFELAMDSYRFGFTHIALGHMVQQRLRDEAGVPSHLVPFSCDTDIYRRVNRANRSGVAFYTQPTTARRGYLLGVGALEELHRRHPDQEIHLYGSSRAEVPFPVTAHGRVTPAELNELYNRCLAGLAMSFTNISLVAEEMLAAGCIPVVNDSRDSRADLDNPHVAWTRPTITGFADALSQVVESPDPVARSSAAAASVRGDNWSLAAHRLTDVIERTVAGSVPRDAAQPNDSDYADGDLVHAPRGA